MKRNLFAAAALCAGLSAPAPVLALGLQQDFSSFIVIGDSLSDDGNLFAATGGAVPASPPYFQGRFSDGPVWSDMIAAEFEGAGKPAANVAFGGARATTATGGAFDIPDLEQQLQILGGAIAGGFDPGPRPLTTVWLGANDAFGARDAGDPAAIGRQAADDVADAVLQLAGLGFMDFILPNLPTLGDTPNYAADPVGGARVAEAGLAYNARLALDVAGLRTTPGLTIYTPDMLALFEALEANPSAYGITEPDEPCLDGGTVCADPSGYALFDDVHPTTLVHGYIADEIRASVAAAVPVPAAGALLLLGVGAFAGLRRRAAA